MEASNSSLYSPINIKDICSNYETEEQMIEAYSENAAKLIGLFEAATGADNREFVKGTDLVNKIFKKITVLDHEKRLEETQIEQIISLSNRIHPTSDYFEFCASHLSMGNVFSYLKNAKEANSENDFKKCLDYISQETGVKMEVKEDRSIAIEISDPKTPWAEFSKSITNLSKIFDDHVGISFNPSNKEKVSEILAFIETNGKLITSLDLKTLGNFVGTDFVEKSIKSCPNLYQLFIKSDKIEDKGLAAVGALKSLTVLDLYECGSLTALPALPDGLKALNLSWCEKLTALPALPHGLKALDLHGCGSLTALPALPSGLTALALSECESLTALPETLPSGLTSLNLYGCRELTKLPALPAGLTSLNLTGCSGLTELPPLPSGLTALALSGCESLAALPPLPSGVTALNLSVCSGLTALPSLPSGLTTLNLTWCSGLTDDVKLATLSGILDQDFFQGIKLANGFDIKDKARINALLLPKIEQKMTNPALPEDLLKLANYIYSNQRDLGLHDEHPLMQEAINIRAINEQPGLKNPFSLFKKLKDLFQVASDFTPDKMDVAGVDVRINMDQLKAMSGEIKRADLPEMVTSEAFDRLFNDLKNKVDADGGAADEALSALGTSFAQVQMPISGDPTQYLKGLLKLSGENVSEVEAKWRAVLWNILEKDHSKKDGHFFTEQEEVFIKTMMGIQNCGGGKAAGIASSYEQLDSKYRYKVKLSKPMSVMEAETEDKKLKGIAFIKEFVNNQSPGNSTEVMAENLAAFVNADLRNRSVNITPWLEDESFWDEESYELNKAGGYELLKIAKKEELKILIGETVQKLVASQFSGTNLLMQELVGTNAISQGSHQAIYLKNLIGNLVGVSQAVTFDRHTGVLYDNLINKTREEVLSTFFKHVTPEVMVNEVLRTLKEPSTETTEALKAFLPEDKYWDENGALSKQGALELLVTLNYVA